MVGHAIIPFSIGGAVDMYYFQAVLNPNETCEVPNEGDENHCLVFDNYQTGGSEFKIGIRKHHLLLCMEIFRSEMEYSRANGSEKLFKKLKEAGHYPYSDLNRQPVA